MLLKVLYKMNLKVKICSTTAKNIASFALIFLKIFATNYNLYYRLDVKEKLAWPTGNLPSDGSEECIVEGLRVILGKDTSCSSAIIALCLTSFFSFGFFFVATILTLRRR